MKIKEKRLENIKVFLDKGYTADIENGKVFNTLNKKCKTLKNGYITLDTTLDKKHINLSAHQLIYFVYTGKVVEQIDLWPDYVVLNFHNQDINSDPIAVPAGAYLGYVSLEDDSRMLYIGDNNFNSEADDGRDPFSLELDWGYDGEFILSERDAHAPQLISKEDSD